MCKQGDTTPAQDKTLFGNLKDIHSRFLACFNYVSEDAPRIGPSTSASKIQLNSLAIVASSLRLSTPYEPPPPSPLVSVTYRKYAMRSGRSFVHGRFRDCAVSVAQEEVIQCLFFVRRQVNRQVSEAPTTFQGELRSSMIRGFRHDTQRHTACTASDRFVARLCGESKSEVMRIVSATLTACGGTYLRCMLPPSSSIRATLGRSSNFFVS